MILVLVVALLASAALAYVVLPLGQRRPAPDELPALEAELQGRKRSALEAIVDLEADRSVGKLSHEDFATLRAQYEADALSALTELDDLGGRASTPRADDLALEEEVAAMRLRLECPSCGAMRAADGTCPRCEPAS